jgi:Protein of unknown function (DUF3626)
MIKSSRAFDANERVAEYRKSVAVVQENLLLFKGFLGQTIKDRPDLDSVGIRAARAAGVIVDALGKLRCPPGTPNANQFTDMQMSNCLIPSAETAAKEVASFAGKMIDGAKEILKSENVRNGAKATALAALQVLDYMHADGSGSLTDSTLMSVLLLRSGGAQVLEFATDSLQKRGKISDQRKEQLDAIASKLKKDASIDARNFVLANLKRRKEKKEKQKEIDDTLVAELSGTSDVGDTPKIEKSEVDTRSPTDDIAEAKATGRPLRILQNGTFPKPVQDNYDRSVLLIQDPSTPDSEVTDLVINHAKIAKTEYENLGFTSNEARTIVEAQQDLLRHKRWQTQRRDGNESAFDRQFGEERRLETATEILKNARIVVAIQPDLLDKIFESGRFKSQFETGTSMGALDFDQRAQSEAIQLGYHPSVDPSRRPIYGYLTKGGKIDQDSFNGVRMYGAVQLMMKPEIESRSTYTGGDSLGRPTFKPAPVGTPEADAVWSPEESGWNEYAEAQLHGGVSVEDIDFALLYVVDNPFGGNGVTEENFEIISAKLKKAGIGVMPVRKGQMFDVQSGTVKVSTKIEVASVV